MAVFPQGHVLSLYSELSSSQKMIMVAGGRRNLKKKKKWKGTHVLEDGPRADTVEKQVSFIYIYIYMHCYCSTCAYIQNFTPIQSNYISRCKFFFYFAQKKLLFLFYTLIFIKYPHQFIYSTHLFNKIFIIFPFFIILSLTETHLPQNNPLSLSLTDPNHHHTNHQILAPTKHLFITLFITSFSPRRFSGFRRLILLCCDCEG